MLDGIMIGSECADWWAEQVRDYKQELEAYVVENPTYWGVAVATVKATGAEFANMYFVDLARLGEGLAQGGVKGLVSDLARAISIIPPAKILGKAPTFLGRAVQYIQNIRFWRTVGGGFCSPIAIGQALQRTGQRFAIGLEEIARAAGVDMGIISKGGLDPSLIAPTLQKLGVEFSQVSGAALSNFDAVLNMARTSPGPIMVGLKGVQGGAHRILVGATTTGVQIIDRYGAFRNLETLSRHYNISFVFNPQAPILVIKNAIIDLSLLSLVNEFSPIACLVRLSLGVLDFNRSQVDPETVKEGFKRFLTKKRGAPIQGDDILIVGGKSIEVAASDPSRSTLSGISKAQYGTFDLWPLIYDLNKSEIGPNPNRLKAGLRLLVLPIERYTAAEIANAKQRAPTWKNYA